MPAPVKPPRPGNEGPQISVEPVRYQAGDLIAEKYRLEDLLGKGGMGSVWRARNLALGVDVAVKLVHGELASPEMTERLQREAHAAARLEHPSAVRVFDLGQTELGDPFIVMELLRGESLRELLDRSGTLPADEAVALVLPIASALSAAHLKGIVHRDLKPDNIVLVEQGGTMVPKVVDFGIAKVDATKFDRRSTSEGTILGSPDYMSPEQARGDDEHIDARTDIWSLGVVLFELLSGKPPFAAAHPLALLRSIIENDAPTLESLDAADPKLSRIVERALAKDHVMRWADMRAFGRALADWALANGIDTDVTGASIAAHWTRSSRTSITNEGATTAARLAIRVSQPSDGKGVTVPSQTRADRMSSGPELAVWQGGGSPARSRRWLVVTGVVLAVAASVGLVVTLSPRLHGARSGVAASAPPTVEATSTPIIEPSVPAASVSAPAPAASTAEAVASQAPSAAPALPVDVPVCVAGLFPVSSFQPNAALDKVCSEADPRQGAALLRSELTRHGFLAKQTTEAMRLWSNLSWYELAAFAVVRGACCSSEGLAPIDLPPSVGACPSLGTSLDELVRVVRERGEADAAVATFRQTALCIERGHRLNESLQSPFAYKGAPGGGAESAFRRILERAQAR